MPDQELTALRIKIEADVKAALDKLDALSAKMVAVSSQVVSSVTRINTALKTIDGKVIDLKLNVQGQREVDALKKQLESVRAAAGNAVNAPTSSLPQVRQKQQAVVPSESEISSFVSAVKAGVAVSVDELKKFRSALTALFESKKLQLGVDNTEVLQLKKDLEFLSGFINASKRDIKIRVSTEGDAEIRQKLNNLQKDYVLRIIPSFNDSDFNKLLTEIQNKRINLTFEDVSDAIKEEIRKVEAISANLPIGADTSAYDAKVNQLRNSLTKVQAIQVNADTKPAELSLKQLQDRATTILAKQQELKLRAQILLPSGELSALQATKKRLEADKIRLKGTAEFGEINANLEAVKRRIAELNSQGVKLQVTTGEIISNASVQRVNNTIALVKELKKTAGDIRVDFKGNGLDRLNGQANQTVRNIEQIIRDTPSFAISAQQGFIAISNNIGPLTDSFGRLAAEARASGQSIGKALAGALGGWNAIGIAISLAVTAVAVFGKEIFGVNEKVEKLKDYFKEIKDIVDKTKLSKAFGVSDKVADLTVAQQLIEGIKKGTLDKDLAIDKLISIDKNAFGPLKDGVVTVDALDKAYKKYGATLLANSIIEKKKASITDLSNKKAENDLKLTEARDKLIAANERLNQAREAAAKLTSAAAGPGGVPVEITNLKNAQKDVDAARTIFSQYQKAYADLSNGIASEQKDIQSVLAASLVPDTTDVSGKSAEDVLKERFGLIKERLELELKNLKVYNDKFNDVFTETQKAEGLDKEFDLEKQILDIERVIKLVGVVDPTSISEIEKIIEEKRFGIEQEYGKESIQIGVATIDTSGIQEFERQLAAARERIREKGITGTDNLKKKEKIALPEFVFDERVFDLEDRINQIRKLAGQGLIPKDVFDDILPQMENFNSTAEYQIAVLEKLKEIYGQSQEGVNAFSARISALNKEIANLLASGLSEFFNDLFDGLVEDGKLTFEELGNAVQKFVIELIKATAKLLIFKAIANALGVGSASDLLGQIVRPRKFATGGIITGPTFGMVGESGTEAVLPLNYLNNLLSDVGGSANLQARVSGDDLLFVMSRANKRNNRFF